MSKIFHNKILLKIALWQNWYITLLIEVKLIKSTFRWSKSNLIKNLIIFRSVQVAILVQIGA